MPINFINITSAVVSAAESKPGHSDVLYLAPAGWFDTIQSTLSDGTPGSTKRVTGTHTFNAGKGWLRTECKAKSIDPTGDAQGEAGGQVPSYKYKVIIKGDSPEILEFVEGILNEDLIAIFNGPICGTDNFTQIGNECSKAQISGFAFRGGSRANGGFKEYEFVIESSEKVFYEGAITEYVDAENVVGGVSSVVVEDIATTTASVTWTAATDAAATSYSVDIDTDAAFGTADNSSVAAPTVAKAFTSLTADTVYYVRVRGVSSVSGIAPGAYSYASFRTDP